MRLRHWMLPLACVAAMTFVGATTMAQDDDNPYGDEPDTAATAATPRPKPKSHAAPTPRPKPKPHAAPTRPMQRPSTTLTAHQGVQTSPAERPAQPPSTQAQHEATRAARPAQPHQAGPIVHDAQDVASTHRTAPHVSEHAAEKNHEGGEHHDHNAAPESINWFYGMLGTKDKLEEPSLLWRPPTMPPPYAALAMNFLLFGYIIYRYGKKPLNDSLKDRKKMIQKEMDAAQKMKADAEARLAEYRDKLDHLDAEMDRIRREFREQGEREKKRILAEAESRRERMLEDAKFMIEQEAKRLLVQLRKQSVDAAVSAAEKLLLSTMTSSDESRAQQDYLKQLDDEQTLRVSKGGSA